MDAPGYRVLLLEDSEWDAKVAKEALETAIRAKFDVTLVRTLADACLAMRTGQFDAAVCDLNLPDSMGVGTIAAMRREAGPDRAIVALTRSSKDASGMEAIDSGADEFVTKQMLDVPESQILPRSVRLAIMRHQTEQRIRALANDHERTLQAIPDLIARVDADGRILWVNHATEIALGHPASELVGQKASFFTTPETSLATEASIRETTRSTGTQRYDIRIPFADGTIHDMVIDDVAIADAGGRATEAVGIARDVTAQVKLEHERIALERAAAENAKLAAIQAERGRLFNAVAHEVNNPLSVLMMQVEMLKEHLLGNLTPQQEHSVEVLDHTLERMRSIMSDMLDLARIQAGQLKLRKARVDLRQVARETAEAYAPLASKASLALDVRTPPDAVMVDVDPRRVTQAIVNFLTNAIKFTPKGGRITIHVDEDAGQAVVRVTDTGKGIDPELVPRLFQPFSQIEGDRGIEGTGLGLYITRGIIEDHGGEVGCSSEGVGQGATFWAALPLAPATPSTS